MVVEAAVVVLHALTWPVRKSLTLVMYLGTTLTDLTAGNRAEVKLENANARARDLIGKQVALLETQLVDARTAESSTREAAIALVKKADKQGAATQLRRSKQASVRATNVQNQLRQAEVQLDALDQTLMVKGIVQAQREVNEAMGRTNLRALADDALDVSDDLSDMQEDLAGVQLALQSNHDTTITDAELIAELEETLLDEQLADLEMGQICPPTPTKASTAHKKQPFENNDKKLSTNYRGQGGHSTESKVTESLATVSEWEEFARDETNDEANNSKEETVALLPGAQQE